MNAAVRDLLKRRLSRKAFRRASYWWWYGKIYLPRRVASDIFRTRRNPTVHGLPSEILDQVQQVNIFAPTPICRIMTRHGSDKGDSWHSYTAVYSVLFKPFQNGPIRIFELGLGSNTPGIPQSMGVDGIPGASLRGWREIFPQAQVFGADIDRKALFNEERINTFYCDQLDLDVIRQMWAQPQLQEEMDIIIDDGLHRIRANTTFLDGSIQHLRKDGIFAVEDIRCEDLLTWQNMLPEYRSRYPSFDFVLLELPNRINSYDNNMLIAKRRV